MPGKGTGAVHKAIRDILPHLDKDRFLSPEIRKLHDFIASGKLVAAAEEAVGALHIGIDTGIAGM